MIMSTLGNENFCSVSKFSMANIVLESPTPHFLKGERGISGGCSFMENLFSFSRLCYGKLDIHIFFEQTEN